jgi:ABC-type transporter Mla subunit MlaD
MALRGLGPVFQLLRRLDRFLEATENNTRTLEKVRDELRALEKRVAALEGREELLVEKTRSAAAVAARNPVTQHLVDMSRRIGALEAVHGSSAADRVGPTICPT